MLAMIQQFDENLSLKTNKQDSAEIMKAVEERLTLVQSDKIKEKLRGEIRDTIGRID